MTHSLEPTLTTVLSHSNQSESPMPCSTDLERLSKTRVFAVLDFASTIAVEYLHQHNRNPMKWVPCRIQSRSSVWKKTNRLTMRTWLSQSADLRSLKDSRVWQRKLNPICIACARSRLWTTRAIRLLGFHYSQVTNITHTQIQRIGVNNYYNCSKRL